ncbi:hypothetical protein [Shewanella pneumatophori]|uniref:Uncharacterized protein n=1 Tax=Shewanella pneumatophori TaxID=314092 RepID=A0A9X1ZGB9_9GAMM|nr:hypothetical protein [Shewanella pneumatophori]MCL1139387.1 hypothetical protein [Shewanella pneumatophori]
MSEYFFARENVGIACYVFADEYIDAVPVDSFTFPAAPVPLVIQYDSEEGCSVPDVFEMPAFSLRKSIFNTLDLQAIAGTNWVDIDLVHNGNHEFVMLQVANHLKAIDRVNSDIKRYRKDDDGDEMISGIRRLHIDQKALQQVELAQRLIFIDPAWYKQVFFHKSVVEQLTKLKLTGVEFIPAEGYSDFGG